MILKALIDLLSLLLNAALFLFPNWEPPTGPGFAALAAANIVLPLDTWALLSGATVAVLGVGLTIWLIMKAVNLFRGSGA